MSAIPQRIQRSRQRRMLSPNGLSIICVDRSTKWGNPFKVGEEYSRQEAVDKFAEYVEAQGLDVEPLRGKNLACWCPLSEPCHADILLRLANESEKD